MLTLGLDGILEDGVDTIGTGDVRTLQQYIGQPSPVQLVGAPGVGNLVEPAKYKT